MPHDKEYFYKYYTAKSAILTLQNVSQKWSNPLEFNDPFDNQFDFCFEEPNDQDIDELLETFIIKSFKSSQSVPGFPSEVANNLEKIQAFYRILGNIRLSEEHKKLLKDGLRQGISNVEVVLPELQKYLQSIIRTLSIFCISEVHDSILMWSHYSDNHKGAAIKFLSLKSVDSPLLCAKPVCYSQNLPKTKYTDFLNFSSLHRRDEDIRDLLTLTKSEVWSYEKEWRIVTELTDKNKTHEFIKFHPEEVGAVYLGCRMEKSDKEQLTELVRTKYPKASIYQAIKKPTQFALDFLEIS